MTRSIMSSSSLAWASKGLPPASLLSAASCPCTKSLFTNAKQMKRRDPYVQLGLTWGATLSEIKHAFREKAKEFHPDRLAAFETDSDGQQKRNSLRQFQEIQEAYQTLVKHKSDGHLLNDKDSVEEWSFAVWRNGDVIAQERTDVAGEMRKRPAKPASVKGAWGGVAALGHPSGRGVSLKSRRGEYLTGSQSGKQPRSSTVGTGRSKWVKPREFKPWNPDKAQLNAKAGVSHSTQRVVRPNASKAET